jgi:hypothetical protein
MHMEQVGWPRVPRRIWRRRGRVGTYRSFACDGSVRDLIRSLGCIERVREPLINGNGG